MKTCFVKQRGYSDDVKSGETSLGWMMHVTTLKTSEPLLSTATCPILSQQTM